MAWLIVLGNKAGTTWVLENERMAFRSHHNTTKMEPGDKFVLYRSRGALGNPGRDGSQVLAVGTIASDVHHTEVTIENAVKNKMPETFPKWVELNFEEGPLPVREGMPFKPLVDRLSWIRKPEAWANYVRKSLLEIPDKDEAIIREAFNQHLKQAAKS